MKVKPAKDARMAEIIRTMYHNKLELNMMSIPECKDVEDHAYNCWQARVDARRYARLLWKEHDISRYEYLEREFPEKSYQEVLDHYDGDFYGVIAGSTKTNEQVDKMTFGSE